MKKVTLDEAKMTNCQLRMADEYIRFDNPSDLVRDYYHYWRGYFECAIENKLETIEVKETLKLVIDWIELQEFNERPYGQSN